MKHIKKYENYSNTLTSGHINLKIAQEIKNILNKCVDLSFDSIKAEEYKKEIKIITKYNSNIEISLSTPTDSFLIELSFNFEECNVDEYFTCSKKLKINIDKNLNTFLDEIYKSEWTFNKSDFMKRLPDIDTIINANKYNL